MSNNTRTHLYKGTKLFKYKDGEDKPTIVRVYDDDGIDTITIVDDKNNKTKMLYEDIRKEYTTLKADGTMCIAIVSIGDGSDVVVTLQNNKSVSRLPYAICRQAVTDFFSNNTKENNGAITLGVSVTQDTCPADINFMSMLSCVAIKQSLFIAVYLDDSLDDILKLFSNRRYDKVLTNLAPILQRNVEGNVLGLSTTLKDLLTTNSFMYDFRKCFGIIEVPFAIKEESEQLSEENVLFLEGLLKQNIMETYIIKYSREIDMSTIRRKHILVTSEADRHDAIYIVAYDVTDKEYTPRN